mmetsp:Transcript_106540/g.159395  ORF Transcript_106540/g.159395 Transcript_106540/m.159395 type:complete len:83 (-) Transcript_106540:591-839(-)
MDTEVLDDGISSKPAGWSEMVKHAEISNEKEDFEDSTRLMELEQTLLHYVCEMQELSAMRTVKEVAGQRECTQGVTIVQEGF